MRAYMSRPDSVLDRIDAMWRTGREYQGQPGEEVIARLAEQEAEMILADTEPTGAGWGKLPYPTTHPFKAWNGVVWEGEPIYLFVGDVHYNRPYCDELRLALADALASFVAMPLDCPHFERDWRVYGEWLDSHEQYEHDHYCYNQGGHKHYSAEA